jgi:DNA-binding transcriptional LysR family regulator
VSRLPDLEAWAIFARIAETGSFARAAAELNLSTATVSKAIGRLESRLGASLLNRTSRRLSLTALGQAAAERASRLLAETEEMEGSALAQTAAPRGLVRIAAPMSFGQREIAPLLPELLRRYPELTVDLQLADRLVDLVAEGFDFALRIGRLADSSLRSRRIRAIPILLVAAPAYVAARGEPAHPRELPDHACVVYAHHHMPVRWCFTHPTEGEVAVTPNGALRLNNGEVALPALRAGLAVAMLPEFLVREDLQSGALVPVMRPWALPDADLSIVSPPGALRPPRIAASMEFFHRSLAHGG